MDLFDQGRIESGQVRLDIGSGVEFEATTVEGEYFGIGYRRHGVFVKSVNGSEWV